MFSGNQCNIRIIFYYLQNVLFRASECFQSLERPSSCFSVFPVEFFDTYVCWLMRCWGPLSSNLVLGTSTEMGLALEEATGHTGGNFRAGLFSLWPPVSLLPHCLAEKLYWWHMAMSQGHLCTGGRAEALQGKQSSWQLVKICRNDLAAPLQSSCSTAACKPMGAEWGQLGYLSPNHTWLELKYNEEAAVAEQVVNQCAGWGEPRGTASSKGEVYLVSAEWVWFGTF